MRSPSRTEQRLLDIIAPRPICGYRIGLRYMEDHGHEISSGKLYVTLRYMVEAGWVTVSYAEDADGRVNVYKATEYGHKVLRGQRDKIAVAELSGLVHGWTTPCITSE